MGEALAWSDTHACRFDISKYQMVHFTKNEKKYTEEQGAEATLLIRGTPVRPSESAKYLGVILDRHLRFHEQVDAAVAKGTATVLAISRLTRPTFGLAHKHVRQLYRAVAVP
ncbi:uncharacterized protein SCHCODRAFT_02476098, partial [Schizophyllum commune H4-8]|uniref:uncharacterized protein n=1 Tax=Schizophyllum commune (strain H4-8 / FGSC 9210) TaxID=578458 RepID=UPI00215EEDFA